MNLTFDYDILPNLCIEWQSKAWEVKFPFWEIFIAVEYYC